MTKIEAKTRARIWGSRNSWSLAPHKGAGGPGQECDVSLDIQGDDRNGYNLVMEPTGFFTADQWYKTKEEALADAVELFGLSPDAWSVKPDSHRDGEPHR